MLGRLALSPMRKQNTFRIDETDLKELSRIAAREKRSLAFLVKHAVAQFISRDKIVRGKKRLQVNTSIPRAKF